MENVIKDAAQAQVNINQALHTQSVEKVKESFVSQDNGHGHSHKYFEPKNTTAEDMKSVKKFYDFTKYDSVSKILGQLSLDVVPVASKWATPFAITNRDNNTCIIKSDLAAEHMNHSLDNVLSPEMKAKFNFTDKEIELNQQWVARHEMTHCDNADFRFNLNVTSDPKLNKAFTEMVGGDRLNVVGRRLDETQADTFAAAQMLQENDTPELRSMLMKQSMIRTSESTFREGLNSWEHEYSASHHGLNLLLSESKLKELKELPKGDIDALRNFSMGISTVALKTSMAEAPEGDTERFLSQINYSNSKAANTGLSINMNSYFYNKHKDEFKGQSFKAVMADMGVNYQSPESFMAKETSKYFDQMQKNAPQDYDKIRQSYQVMGKGREFVPQPGEMNYLMARSFLEQNREKLSSHLNQAFTQEYGMHPKEVLGKIATNAKEVGLAPSKLATMSDNLKMGVSDLISGGIYQKEANAVVEKKADDLLKQTAGMDFKSYSTPKNFLDKLNKVENSFVATEKEHITRVMFKPQ